jgi:putative ABC transport system permease protein
LWPGEEPIGKPLRAGGSDEPVRQVIGVARDGKYDSLNESPRAFVYLPQGRSPLTEAALVVRAAGDPGPLLGPLREIVHGLDPNLPVFRASTLAQAIRGTLDKQRAASALVGVFGLVTLALAALGIYGVMAHSVTLRTREIGIRMSLGARVSDVSRMVVRDGVRLSMTGVAIGLVLSGLIATALAAFLYGLTPADSAAFVVAAALLCAVAALASYLPARRAARVDPLVALRHD